VRGGWDWDDPAVPADVAHLLAVARGERAPDLVIEGASVFSSFTREWLEVDVAVARGRIAGFEPAAGGRRIDGRGRYLVPGFVDAHVHTESSKLGLDEFARVLLARGTTTVVADPHEFANVLGAPGVEWFLDACATVPLDVFVMVPSCVPASPLESARGPLGPDDMRALLGRPRVLGIAEMMNFPAVIAGDDSELAKLALAPGGNVDGHAPGVAGPQLDAYLAAGIRTDHETTTWEEALERRRRGAWVLIREASNARNLSALLELVRRHGPERCAFCTDDREPDMLVREGHLDQMCRVAVAEGVSAEDALVMATLNPALCHGLTDRGAIAPGYRADLVLLEDLEGFAATLVLKDGEEVTGRPATRAELPGWLRTTVNIAPVPAEQLRVPSDGGRVRVIELVPDQLLTHARELAPTVVDGAAVADPARDLAKIAVVERHHASGRVGIGFVQGFGLQRGAFASTVAHDAHNLIVVGVDDEAMAACVARLEELGGGIVAIDGDRRAELPLPIAGLVSDAPVEEVVERLDAAHATLAAMGVGLAAPFMALSFLGLSVIPSLKLTDLGLVDVERARIVPLEV
jgi:adenine deaminase